MSAPTLTVTIPKDLQEWLKDYKQHNCINISAVITRLLIKWRESINEKGC